MLSHLFKRRTIWCPTLAGWLLLGVLLGISAVTWGLFGERWLSESQPEPGAKALIVEGWMGIDGVDAAKVEFDRGKYDYLVTSGGDMTSRWGAEQWSYATEARVHLLRVGMPREKVIEAPATTAGNHRTFMSAMAVRQVLDQRGLHPVAVNVFTLGVHARRSRLVFAKALGSGTKVGVISWVPPHYLDGPWWESSERTLDLIKETIGWPFEVLLNSGRLSNHPIPADHQAVSGK